MSELWVSDFLRNPLGFRQVKEGYMAQPHPTQRPLLPDTRYTKKKGLISRYQIFWPNHDSIILERSVTWFKDDYFDTVTFNHDFKYIEMTFKPLDKRFRPRISSRDITLQDIVRKNISRVSGRKALMYVYEEFYRQFSNGKRSVAYANFKKQKLYK